MPTGAQSQTTSLASNTSTSSQFSGPHQGLTELFTGMYGNALKQNAGVYQDILKGYDTASINNRDRANAQQAQYNALNDSVQQGLMGSDQAERQRIASGYEVAGAGMQQGLVNSGLSNSTIGANLQRGLLSDKNRADMELSNRTAQQAAGYQASLVGAGIGAQQQGSQLAAQQYGNYNSALAGWKSPYPTWAPNYTQSDSAANSSSSSQSYSVQKSLPDVSAPGTPAGLNAGTPGPLYTPASVPGNSTGSSSAIAAYQQGINSFVPPNPRAYYPAAF